MLSSELPCSKPHHHPHPYKTFFCSSSQKPPFMVKSPKTLSCATHIRYPLVHDPPPACAVLSRSLPSNSLPSVCSVDSAWPLSFHHVSWTRRILHQLGLHSRKNLAALTKQTFRVGGREFKRKKKRTNEVQAKGVVGSLYLRQVVFYLRRESREESNGCCRYYFLRWGGVFFFSFSFFGVCGVGCFSVKAVKSA